MCYLTYTTEETHRIIRENLDRSPIYSGVIEGIGPGTAPPRNEVVRFADKPRHQLFIEPMGLDTEECIFGASPPSMRRRCSCGCSTACPDWSTWR